MTSTTDWDPDLYARFEALRSRPFWDLVDLVDLRAPVERMVDLGCGTGELTVELANRLEATDVIGVDSSPAMLERANRLFERSDRPPAADRTVHFRHGDIATWTGTDHDLIIANASLQWVPDHADVLARWCDALAPGGRLAVQVPANAGHPSHTCSVAVAHRQPFLEAFDGTPPPDPVTEHVLEPERYSVLLHELGIDDPVVHLVVYPQLMPSSASVVEWVSGTSLTRFFARLPEQLHQPFVDAFTAELLSTIGDHRPYLYTFKRILMGGMTRT